MGCYELFTGQDIRCQSFAKKYYQQIVLVNKADVVDFQINSDGSTHNIKFQLGTGLSGVLFAGSDNASVYTATFSKNTDNGVSEYSHSVQLPVMGVSEETKTILKQLDSAQYFAAIQFMDGTVEIYGWEYGLKPNDYTYDPQGGGGGSVINLSSEILEDEIPYVYVSAVPGNENDDFNSLFADNEPLIGASFNDDFNDDFDTIVV